MQIYKVQKNEMRSMSRKKMENKRSVFLRHLLDKAQYYEAN